MNDILDPPTDRDMPAGRSARMRAELLANLRRPARQHHARRRIALVAAAVVAAAGATATVNSLDRGPTRILAMGQSEFTPSLLEAAEECLRMNTQMAANDQPAGPTAMADLAVAAQRGDVSAVLFLNPSGYLACESSTPSGGEPTGGASGGPWESWDWLPGQVQRLLLTSTDIEGGDVTVIGRVSDHVHNLVLNHGDGHTTSARLDEGLFGLISDGHPVKKNAELISYDANGTEIGRNRLFQPSDPPGEGRCYVNPAGNVVYGKPGPSCLPAQPRTR